VQRASQQRRSQRQQQAGSLRLEPPTPVSAPLLTGPFSPCDTRCQNEITGAHTPTHTTATHHHRNLSTHPSRDMRVQPTHTINPQVLRKIAAQVALHTRDRREAGAVLSLLWHHPTTTIPRQWALLALSTSQLKDTKAQPFLMVPRTTYEKQEAYHVKHGCQRASVATTAVRISPSSRHVNQNRLQKRMKN
jgi:hypothetical protein